MNSNPTIYHPARDNSMKGTNAMGPRHDVDRGARMGTTTLERPATRTTRQTETGFASTLDRPQTYAPHRPRAPRQPAIEQPQRRGRLGSKQVVSVRGRRVANPSEAKRAFSTVSLIVIPLLIIGVITAMLLSGFSTSQSFSIQQLQTRERQLNNEVESLNRNLEDRKSSAEITQRAAEFSMVVPSEPGIVSVRDDGNVEQQRDFNPDMTQAIVDVNGSPARSDRATSDRNATSDVGDRLTSLPGGNVLGRPELQNQPENQPQGQLPNEQTPPNDQAASVPNTQHENLAPYAPNVAPRR